MNAPDFEYMLSACNAYGLEVRFTPTKGRGGSPEWIVSLDRRGDVIATSNQTPDPRFALEAAWKQAT